MNKYVEIVSLKVIREARFLAQDKVESPEGAHTVFRQFMTGEMDREHFALLCLDAKHRPTAIQLVAIGTLDSLLIHPREVYKTAILTNAVSIICAHWHPSGDSEPSLEDLKMTCQLWRAGELLGIKLLDHLILGAEDRFFSLMENGMMESLHKAKGGEYQEAFHEEWTTDREFKK